MSDLPFALALTAGMLAAVNPCGFALLPAYLSLLVLGEDAPSRAAAVGRALVATAAMTAGFTVVFAVFGLAVAPVAGQVQEHLPWFTVVFGLVLAGLGGWLAAGRALPAALLPKLRRAPEVSRSLPSMALFGAAYAVASLGCTIAPFLAIVVSAFRGGSPLEGTLLFVAYAAGMGVIVGAAALTVALTRTARVGALRRVGGVAARLGGGLLLLAGAYVAYYGWYEIRVLRGDVGGDPVVEAAGAVQTRLAEALGAVGVPAVAAVALALLALGAAPVVWRRRAAAAVTRRRDAGAARRER
ncbi:cytochrome c biogenesis protein CcdA [Streptomyces sp. MUM 203J]|uniref:cytochrome c biogenesis CcdA family protein n=1 Tax=Streptomyces sp. MUM 203J TaxID=2791990 RepID=UPI001F033739|nr:cytochrome c biogenesis protein CcdA [Streptomyces sp. MUM 203J]MCH0542643.1 cytochrome c biogenesis protein CcdA [Streptomyces sp. MUM 203J]